MQTSLHLFISLANSPTISIKSEIDSSIHDIKQIIKEKLQIKNHHDDEMNNPEFRLVSSLGKSLNDDSKTLQYYLDQQIIREYSTLNLQLNLCGGGKKKRKRKKIVVRAHKGDHRHVNIPLHPITMKHYEFNDGMGKIICNRMNCPQCGVGCLMAYHGDRNYCGKCHLTLVVSKTISSY